MFQLSLPSDIVVYGMLDRSCIVVTDLYILYPSVWHANQSTVKRLPIRCDSLFVPLFSVHHFICNHPTVASLTHWIITVVTLLSRWVISSMAT